MPTPRSCTLAAVLFLMSAAALAQSDNAADRLPPRSDEVLRAILQAGKDPNRDVRSLVAWTIERMGCKEGVDVLKTLASDPAPEVRAGALRSLCEFLPKGTAVVVALAVPVEDAQLRTAALRAARMLQFEQRSSLIKAALETGSDGEKVLALEALEMDSVASRKPMLLAALKDKSALIRAAALRTMGSGADPDAPATILPFIAEKTSDQSFHVRAAACQALGQLKAKNSLQEVALAASDAHFCVRRAAIRAIVAIGHTDGVPAIQARATDTDYTVRVAACQALAELISPSSAGVLVDRMFDGTPEVRDVAVESLIKFPADLGYAAVLRNADNMVRRDVRLSTWRILGEYAHPGTREVAFSHLTDKEPDVQGYALRILRKLEDPRVAPNVTAWLTFARGKPAPIDLIVEEAYRCAIRLKLKEPGPSAVLAFTVATEPIGMPPPPFMPGDTLLTWACRYTAAMDYKAAVPALDKLYELRKNDVSMSPVLAKTLEQLTGKKYAFAVSPPQFGHYFIDAAP